MIAPIILRNYKLFKISLLLAFIIHLSIFSFFILTVPAYNPSNKPTFFFLGAILKPKDFMFITNKKKNKTTLESSKKISAYFIKDPNVSVADRAIIKPVFSKNVLEKKEKTILKPTFLEEEDPSKIEDLELFKKIGISEKMPSYQPLSLH